MIMLSELIERSGIKNACIIDDANDREPLLKDLTSLSDEWNNLLDDIPHNEDLINDITKKIPDFDIENFSMKSIDDQFVKTLWSLKDKYNDEIIPIFEAYESTKLSDNNYVNLLSNTLIENSFSVTKVGRDFSTEAQNADIIFVDLFLYLDQTEDNIEYSIRFLKEIIEKRGNKPPIIVLISRSHRLSEYSERFRDKCGIIESGFRIYNKSDLSNKNKLIFCIKKLLEHYEDSVKVLNFLNSWEKHATQAVVDTVSSLKKLDLLDHNMIQRLLLEEEGQSSASYFMDLFDSILLHNFESQSEIIKSAKLLNDIDFSKAPTIQGLQKEPLQDLVFKSVFMGTERCKINESDTIELGDLFKLKGEKTDENDLLQACTGEDNVWLVITPSCDLARDGIKNIGLLRGSLTRVVHNNWQTDTKINTPIIKIEGVPYSIKWDIKSFITYPKSNLQVMLTDNIYYRVAKMREVSALGLQQRFTADYSRIGQRAVLPSVFESSVYLHYLDDSSNLVQLEIQSESKALFYVGSSNKKVVNFSHIDFDNILYGLEKLDSELVHSQAKKNVQKVKSNPYILIEALEGALEVGSTPRDIKIERDVTLAKIVFGEVNQKYISKLKGVGLMFVVQEIKQEEYE
ncbi:hypothetical protein QTO11_14585 [Vibrio campbellii]